MQSCRHDTQLERERAQTGILSTTIAYLSVKFSLQFSDLEKCLIVAHYKYDWQLYLTGEPSVFEPNQSKDEAHTHTIMTIFLLS